MANSGFFFVQYQKIYQGWQNALDRIGSANDEFDHHWKMAENGELTKYGDFVYIDTVCGAYNYTHDQVFNLSWSEVMTIITLGKEKNFIESEAHKTYRAAQK